MRGAPLPPAAARAGPRLQRPSTYALLIVYLVGAWRVATVVGSGFADFPIATGVAVGLFAVYAVPFVLLLRMIDYVEQEPWRLQLMALLWGGLVATSAAISGGTALQNIVATLASPQAAATWGPAISGAVVEEVVKAAGVAAILVVAPGQVNGTLDGFVYGALVGLGFQVVEDVVYSVSAVAVAGADSLGPVVGTFLVRGFLTGLWSHTLFTGLAGAGIAYAWVRRDRSRFVRGTVAAALCLTATGFHFLWNVPVVGPASRLGLVGVVAVMLVKGIPALLVGAALLFAAERRQADYYAGLLAGIADHRIASRDEIATLISPIRRVAARRRARDGAGWAGSRATRRLQRAQARLAVALARDPGAEVLRRRRDVLMRRHQLLAVGMAGRGHGDGRGDSARRGATVFGVAIGVAEVVIAGLLVVGVAVAIRSLA